MFQYTKEVIINSLQVDQDAYGSTAQLDRIQTIAPGVLGILRSGEYRLENIVDGRIYKTPGRVGSTATVTIPITAGLFAQGAGTYRFAIYLRSNNKYLGDYANAAWYIFGKPIMVEVTISDVTAVADNAQLIADAINLAIPYNNLFARAVVEGTNVVIRTTDAYVGIHGVTLEWYNPTGCDSCIGDYERLDIPNLAIVQNVEPFGTGAWIQENLRFPTYPNLRYAALYQDEYPVPGALYTQYSFAYDVVRVGYYGISGVNQKMEAVTRHVYYVLNSLVDDFEDAINDALGDNVIVENNTVIITSGATVANDGIAVRLIADTYPIDDTATITWTATGGTATENTDYTLTSGGVLTVETTAPIGGTIEVTATSSNGDYTAGTKTLTIVAG